MTRLMTSWAWGSRDMGSSCLEHVVAATALEVVGALGEHRGVEQPLVGQQPLEGAQPALVVARRITGALRARDLVDQSRLELAPLEAGVVAHGHGHPEDAALPRLVEHQLAVLARQRGLAGHVGDLAARNGFHHSAPAPRRLAAPTSARGGRTTATPIIESRVTRSASSVSLSCSVPAGRSGSTR